MRKRIGFVGLGIMGSGMAANLLRAGYVVKVFNRTRSKAEELAGAGALIAPTPAEAARGSDVVITMLADPPAVKDAVLGRNGVIEGLAAGAVLVDCSTVDPMTTAATLQAAAEKGARFLDAPVGGSKDAAAAGELLLMVGGDEKALDEVRDVLEVMSRKIIYAGPSGSGTMLKLCFNLMVSHVAAGLSEALVLGVKAGLPPQRIIDALMSGVLASRFIEWKGGCIVDRDFTTNFSIKLMHKDLNLLAGAGHSYDVPLPVTAAVKELFAMAKARGQEDEDFCSVIKVIEDFAGVDVKR